MAGCIVARKLGFKTKGEKPQEPRRKNRIKQKNSLRRDLRCLD